jgi:tRNA threonylcarbamoyladenosine biosynthesis protein TsaB
MNILAFDTCLGAVSVAVRRRGAATGELAGHAFEPRERGHAERLMPMIAEAMSSAGLGFADLDRIAVTVGPGTFTGVRVGVSAARGLVLASGAEVVCASSLAVMALQAADRLGSSVSGRMLAVAIDARRGSVYLQLFAGGRQPAGPPQILEAGEAARLVGASPVVVVGTGTSLLADILRDAGSRAEVQFAELQPDAKALVMLAPDLAPVASVDPLYLRAPDVKLPGQRALPRA